VIEVAVYTEPLASWDSFRVCAYCGWGARYVVWSDDGATPALGYCCAEPTHWSWVVAAVAEVAVEEDSE
jgi:hypothetical protein